MPVGAADALAQKLRAAFADDVPPRLAVAVSGGGDSVALLCLLTDWRQEGGPALEAVTVDHGLRPEAAAEAATVAALCQTLGVPHTTLLWRDHAAGNLMDAARRARLRLIGDWARSRGIGHVALGHTMDDQAETFLMRLARGSGVDGLGGMADRRRSQGVSWVRPLLGLRRSDLRDALRARDVSWIDDPTNDDARFDRVRMRQAIDLLAPLGITPERIVETSSRMRMARAALDRVMRDLPRDDMVERAGGVAFARGPLFDAPVDTRLRAVAAAIRWISSADYRPRLDALQATLAALDPAGRRTLSGVTLSLSRDRMTLVREPRAVDDTRGATGEAWDVRWRLDGPHAKGQELRALGPDGLRQAGNWRQSGLSRDVALVTPGVFRGAALVAAPLVGFGAGWSAALRPTFAEFLLSD